MTTLLFVLSATVAPVVASAAVQSGLIADFAFLSEDCLNGSFADAAAFGLFGDLVRNETTTRCAEGLGVSARNPETSGFVLLKAALMILKVFKVTIFGPIIDRHPVWGPLDRSIDTASLKTTCPYIPIIYTHLYPSS
jgi:hypothetical protein